MITVFQNSQEEREGMTVSEIASAFGALFEGVKLVGDLLKDGGHRKEVMDLQEHALNLKELCLLQFEAVEAEHALRVQAEGKVKELLDAKERLAHYHAVEVVPLFSVLVPNAARKGGEPVDALCQHCADRLQVGRLGLVARNGLDISRGLDALVKCGVCGRETLVQRNALYRALGVG